MYLACMGCKVIKRSELLFFKQKTAYEMLISDWSSDVCSSDLRLQALARAHELTMTDAGDAMEAPPQTNLLGLIEAILDPYSAGNRVIVEGPQLLRGGRSVTHIALLMHERATNAAKYGSLSVNEGRLAVRDEAEDRKNRRLN